jgi:hypothetical protein
MSQQALYEAETGEKALYRKEGSDYHTLRYVRWLEAENAALREKVEAIATWMDTVPISNDWDVLCQAIRKLYAVLRGEGE